MSFTRKLQVAAKAVYQRTIALSKRLDNTYVYISVFVISLLLLLGGLVCINASQAYTSDSTVIQTVFYQHLHISGSGRAWLGEDNYIIKLPFYMLMHALFVNSRAVLFATSIVFNIVGFGLFFYSFIYFVKRFRLNVVQAGLCFIWFFSLATTIVQSFLINPNLRNVEIGMNFFILMLFVRYCDGQLHIANKIWRWIVAALGVSLLGIFFYNDPLFMYMLGAPLLVFFAWRLYFQKLDRRILSSVLFIIVAFGFEALWHKFFQHFGIYSRRPQTQFIAFSQLGTTIPQAFTSYFVIFSSSFWSRNVLSFEAFRTVLNSVLMLGVFLAPWVLIFRKKNNRIKDPWIIFWLLVPVYVTFIFITSTNTTLNGVGALRFLVLAPFFAPISLALLLQQLSNRRTILLANIALAVAILANSLFLGKQLLNLPTTNPNAQNYAVIKAVEQAGLQKGFGNYWDSNIDTYLSNNKIVVIPANCLGVQHFLMDDKSLSIPANHSFYIYNTLFQHCDLGVVFAQLGQPAKIIKVDSTASIFVFNYDITTRMNPGYYYQQP